MEEAGAKPLPSMPLWRKIMFALGQLGWSLASFGVGNLVMYFYVPPVSNGVAVFPSYIFPGLIFGVFTIIGLVNMVARAFDAVTNPIIATWSDTSRSRFGRRRKFMAIAALPFAVLSLLVFLPLQTGAAPQGPADSWLNTVWLCLTILLFYFFFVMYATPYTALLSELGHNPRERLFLSTIISVTWALGFMLGNMVYALKDMVGASFQLPPTQAFQAVLGAFALISAILMFLPVIFCDEKKYAAAHVSNEGVFKALGSTLKNRFFTTFIASEVFYFICLSIMQMGLVYFVTALLNLPDAMVTGLMIVMFLLSFVCYPFVNILGNRLGKKQLLVIAFSVFALDFFLASLMGILAIPAEAYAYLVVCVAAVPIAIFGILPNAVVADIAEAAGIQTGNYKAGIFFGIRTFEMNIGISLANAIFPSLLALGMSVENPTGVRLAAVTAGVLCLVGLAIFLRYREKDVLGILATKH